MKQKKEKTTKENLKISNEKSENKSQKKSKLDQKQSKKKLFEKNSQLINLNKSKYNKTLNSKVSEKQLVYIEKLIDNILSPYLRNIKDGDNLRKFSDKIWDELSDRNFEILNILDLNEINKSRDHISEEQYNHLIEEKVFNEKASPLIKGLNALYMLFNYPHFMEVPGAGSISTNSPHFTKIVYSSSSLSNLHEIEKIIMEIIIKKINLKANELGEEEYPLEHDANNEINIYNPNDKNHYYNAKQIFEARKLIRIYIFRNPEMTKLPENFVKNIYENASILSDYYKAFRNIDLKILLHPFKIDYYISNYFHFLNDKTIEIINKLSKENEKIIKQIIPLNTLLDPTNQKITEWFIDNFELIKEADDKANKNIDWLERAKYYTSIKNDALGSNMAQETQNMSMPIDNDFSKINNKEEKNDKDNLNNITRKKPEFFMTLGALIIMASVFFLNHFKEFIKNVPNSKFLSKDMLILGTGITGMIFGSSYLIYGGKEYFNSKNIKNSQNEKNQLFTEIDETEVNKNQINR